MSSYEGHKGKLIRVCEQGIPLLEQVKSIITKEEFDSMIIELDEYFTISDWIYENYNNEFLIHNDTLYQIKDEDLGEYDIDIFEKECDGVYNYLNTFYNGGTCLDEVLENNLDKLR